MRSPASALLVALGSVLMACGVASSDPADPSQAATPGAEGDICGGIVGLPCGDGMFCEFASNECNTADAAGRCVVVPDVCTEQWDPVCACPEGLPNGKTYSNDCYRRISRAQKAHDGQCSVEEP
jgi:hypothetical protein